MATATCPKCGIPRGAEPQCPACGVIYAKADAAIAARTEREAALAASVMVIPTGISEPAPVDDAALELKFCIAAIPLTLLLGVLFHLMTPGLQRIVFGMPVHEFGHAVCAWFTGHFAIPALWKTPVWDRGVLFPVLLFGAFCYLIFRAWRAENMGLVAVGAVLILLQLWGTLLTSAKSANALIIFGGDGAGMVVATVLMCLFFFGKETQLYKGSLRWGFVAIGAGAFSDMFAVWLAARRDFGRIPFGEQEYAGPSDATRLVDDFGWSTEMLVGRYVGLGVVCLLVLAGVYAWGVWQAKKAADRAAQTTAERAGEKPA